MISIYIYGVKTIKKFWWESGFLRVFFFFFCLFMIKYYPFVLAMFSVNDYRTVCNINFKMRDALVQP